MTPRGWPDTLPPFLWGVATAAHQVEGHDTTSDWAAAEAAGRVPPAGPAADHWNRYPEDLTRFRELGLNAYRFSLDWSRIEAAPGHFDTRSVAHYAAMLDACRARGLAPVVTLHHFTTPAWFAREGGWLGRHAVHAFQRYVEYVVQALPGAAAWCTINEPTMLAVMGHVRGVWPPFHHRPVEAIQLTSRLAAAHRAAWAVLKHHRPDAPVGLAHSMLAMRPASPSAPDRWATALTHRWYNWKFVDLVRDQQDFIGLNYYTRAWVRWRRLADPLLSRGIGPITDMGWEIDPEGFGELLRGLHARYNRPLLVTENGIATQDDSLRRQYLAQHLAILGQVRAEGVPVHGYFYWSGLDNYEWVEGYRPRFGLYHVDYATQTRTRKAGAEVLEAWARRGPPEPAPPP